MKTQINEVKRMQQLAGIKIHISEGFQGDDNEGDGLSGFRGSGQINRSDGLSGFRGKTNTDDENNNDLNFIASNNKERLTYASEGAKAFLRGVMLDYGPYKEETFENDWWRKGWEHAELASIKRNNKIKNI